MVYLRQFHPRKWIQLVRDEGVTTATVVPTMLDRIVSALEAEPVELPTLRNLAYGGSKVALPLARKAPSAARRRFRQRSGSPSQSSGVALQIRGVDGASATGESGELLYAGAATRDRFGA